MTVQISPKVSNINFVGEETSPLTPQRESEQNREIPAEELTPAWLELIQNTLCSIEEHGGLRELEDLPSLNAADMGKLRKIKEEINGSYMIKGLKALQKVSTLAMTFFLGEAALTGIWAFIEGLIPNRSPFAASLIGGSFLSGFPLDYALAGLACKVNAFALGLFQMYWTKRLISQHSRESDLLSKIKKIVEIEKNAKAINGFIDTNTEFLSDERFTQVAKVQETIRRLTFLKSKAFMMTSCHLQTIESNLTTEIFSSFKA